MAFCLTTGTFVATLAVHSLTLTWIHSVEKAEIQEDYSQAGDQLLLTEARIKTSGAGFDPPPGAVLGGGWWRWQPNRMLDGITLARAAAPGEWRICVHNRCQPLGQYLPDGIDDAPVRISACPAKP
jgi:hypothetical protein